MNLFCMRRFFMGKITSSKHKDSTSKYLEHLAEIGVVTDTIYPNKSGRIRHRGTWWPALCTQDISIPIGSTVRVIGFENITCIVEPFMSEKDS